MLNEDRCGEEQVVRILRECDNQSPRPSEGKAGVSVDSIHTRRKYFCVIMTNDAKRLMAFKSGNGSLVNGLRVIVGEAMKDIAAKTISESIRRDQALQRRGARLGDVVDGGQSDVSTGLGG